jgi:hypothetical protein
LRPPNRVQTAIRKSSLEATQQDPSIYKNRRRYSRRTVVVREGGVEAAEQGKAAIKLGYSRGRIWPHNKVQAEAIA